MNINHSKTINSSMLDPNKKFTKRRVSISFMPTVFKIVLHKRNFIPFPIKKIHFNGIFFWY